jgi:hypothetical protein
MLQIAWIQKILPMPIANREGHDAVFGEKSDLINVRLILAVLNNAWCHRPEITKRRFVARSKSARGPIPR